MHVGTVAIDAKSLLHGYGVGVLHLAGEIFILKVVVVAMTTDFDIAGVVETLKLRNGDSRAAVFFYVQVRNIDSDGASLCNRRRD
uniref:Uncharacterized protein n=1 Tax=uncultured marine virus TaxID=186617 RepID=A0A0F7L763_9VIRU|nr:hypothetical protein [uncultured marine virus]